MKTNDMLQKFRISAAKRQAEFYMVSHGKFPKVTKQFVEEEAQRLLLEWKTARQRRSLPEVKVQGIETPEAELNDRTDNNASFECPRCLKKFRVHRRYTNHITSHYSGNGESRNAALMAQAGEGRGLERSSRQLSDAEKEDLRYFLNDAYQ